MNERKKKYLLNMGTSLFSEIVAITCGFVLPRLILKSFGSDYNGLTASISQFISYVALLKSGIGGATRAALYKPLSEKNDLEISRVVLATTRFMQKVAMIFLVALLVFAGIYSVGMRDEFDFIFTFTLVLIIGISTFAQYYFCSSYQMLLKADQREYVTVLIGILTTILNTIVSVILINGGFELRIVKFGSAMVFLLSPIITNLYVKKHYNIIKVDDHNLDVIAQRWDSFAHQLANFVHGNTDIIILTILSTTKEISVYTVYMLVVAGLKKVIISITSGIEALMGNIRAKNEIEQLKSVFCFFEWMVFAVSTILFSTCMVLAPRFVMVYTSGVTDVNYNRPVFCILVCVAEFFACIRIPYESMVRAAGHYKQTKNGALLEPIINIIISLILVVPFGLNGVAIGTCVAMSYRTIRYAIYVSTYLLNINITTVAKRIVCSTMGCVATFYAGWVIVPVSFSGYCEFLIWGVIVSIISIIIYFVVAIILMPKDFVGNIKYLKRQIFKKKGEKNG